MQVVSVSLWPFRVMCQSGHTDCEQIQSSAFGFLSWGGGFGAMVLVQESILYTPSLNQHSAPRSVHLETVMRCCTTDTLASSIRTQPKPEAPSRWRRDKQKHSNCLSQCTDHQASKGGNFISGDTNPKDNPSTPTPTQFFYVFQMEECVLVSIM